MLLVTGGAGYIGAHTIVELLAAGYEVVCLDNYSNSSPAALDRVQRIVGRPLAAIIGGDVRDTALLARVFGKYPIDGVIHFAALKAVAESVAQPLAYYENNVAGTLALLSAMQKAGVTRFVFSSSATVYGAPDVLPVTEDAPIRTANPYGATKAMVEQILRDVAAACGWSVVSLRYFNPIGAHTSGLIGEDPQDVPNNLFPFICQVAAGKRPHLNVFGDDWPTADGTGVRDYLHVMDLAAGHVRAYEFAQRQCGFVALNLGTGRGTSVLELVRAFEAATGQRVPYRVAPRRPGDIAACWADPTRAQQLLGWRATRSVEEACADGWRWQRNNPNGYRDGPS
ncbi:MAG: UDP-glucose 4-epimerase GalE [Sutterellaceae bacterium]|nr:UDP-glucose 4-epimerase GalE [Burkholderiaceae bacterium]MCX7901569.1 UDP-glucose 4-epimerase GalE [Burkholderiaceae bacterium]MDW8430577.1 UDP-glucose 4-epimerase GalE [Sutterellaceae bacterium]